MLNISEMKLLEVIPFVIFGGPLLIIFGVFISGAISLLFFKKEDRGRDVIAKSLSYFIILLTIFLVFVVVSTLVRRGDIFTPKPQDTEFPVSPMGSFPPAPEFFELEGYFFAGPYSLAEKDANEEEIIYVAMCPKEDGYDIIKIGISNKRSSISSDRDFGCWLENCRKEDIKVGIFWVKGDEDNATRDYLRELEDKINFICD